jgi:predicted TIM-barrel fold metal-dependent hydrolase
MGTERVLLAAAPLDHWGTDLTEKCAEILERFPEKVSGLIGIHPPDIDQSLREIDRWHRKGFLGVKLMPTAGYFPNEERFLPMFEEINSRKMIVLTHCGWCSPGVKEKDLPQCTLYSHPYNFEPLIRIFPETDFIFAHGGGRTMFQAAFDLVCYHQNAWVDTCPGHGTWVLEFAERHWLDVLKWERVLFGTDTCFGADNAVGRFREIDAKVRRLLKQSGNEDKAPGVMGLNARRLLERHGVAFS